MTTIKFSYLTRYGEYKDALNLPSNHGLTPQQIEEMKISRRDNWVALMDEMANPVVEEPVVEEPVVEEPAPEQPIGE